MGELSTIGFIAAPYGTFLRVAEGIDSLRNFGASGASGLTSAQRATAIVCGVAQLGGLIWMAVCTIVLGMLCICAPIGSWACLRCYRICRGASRRTRRREKALDDLLMQTGYESEEEGVTSGLSGLDGIPKTRIRASGHVRLSTVDE